MPIRRSSFWVCYSPCKFPLWGFSQSGLVNTWQLLVHIHACHSNTLLRPSFTPPSPCFHVHTFSRCIPATKCICCATLPSIKSHWESVQDAVLRSRGSERWCCVHWSRGSHLHGVHCTLEWKVLLPLRHWVSGGSEVATLYHPRFHLGGEGGLFAPPYVLPPLGREKGTFPLTLSACAPLTILYPTLTPSSLPLPILSTSSYAKIHIPIIASVSEHQPTTWTSFFFDLHILVCVFPAGIWFVMKYLTDERVFGKSHDSHMTVT